jgi:hypothetical protein
LISGGDELPLFFKCGSFLPRTISKSGLSGKSLGENGKKGKNLPRLGKRLPQS